MPPVRKFPPAERRDFFVYIDEFQSFTTLALANMLSELRKYRVGFTVAHQYLHQLEPEVRHAVLGNAGSIISFRVGVEDVPYLVREFHQRFVANLKANGAADMTISKNRWLLEDLAAPIRNRPVSGIVPAELLDILKKIETSGRRDTAHRLRSVMGSVFRLAVATLRATNDPTYALRGALMKVKIKHRTAITDEQELGRFLIALDEYDGWPILQSAFQFLILTMSRPGDVRGMKRTEVNFDKRLWRIPGERMKMRWPHDVPLSRQAIAVLRNVWPLNEEHELVFPSLRSHKKPLSENAFNSVLRNMGYSKDQATAHGFRSTASTILNERGYDDDVIEAALAHQDEDEIRRIYNRALYLPERKKLMQDWAQAPYEGRNRRTRGSALKEKWSINEEARECWSHFWAYLAVPECAAPEPSDGR